jgi:hypothetical protein
MLEENEDPSSSQCKSAPEVPCQCPMYIEIMIAVTVKQESFDRTLLVVECKRDLSTLVEKRGDE